MRSTSPRSFASNWDFDQARDRPSPCNNHALTCHCPVPPPHHGGVTRELLQTTRPPSSDSLGHTHAQLCGRGLRTAREEPRSKGNGPVQRGEKQLSLSGLWLEQQRLREAISKNFLQCKPSCQTWQWEACFLFGELEQPYQEVQGMTSPVAESRGAGWGGRGG